MINKKDTSLFLHYAYFFATILVIANNSLITENGLLDRFIALFHHSDQPGFLDASIMIGNLFTMPLVVFLFGISVYNKIKTSSPLSFLKHRSTILLLWFTTSALIIMPLSYYLLESNNGQDGGFWHYITQIYFKQWLTGPSWILFMIFIFDMTITLFCQFAPTITNNLFATVKNARVFTIILTLFIISIIVFFLTSEFSGSIRFSAIPDAKDASWDHLGPLWLQLRTLPSYALVYLFSVLLGASPKFLDYILSSKSELSKKWLNKIVETALLYIIIKIISKQESLFGSQLALNVVLSFAYMLLMFNLFYTFFSLLSKFAYRESRFLTSLSNYSFMIYIVHFLPLVFIKNYAHNFKAMSAGQKTYIIIIFTFFVSLVLSYLLKRFLALLPKQFKCEDLCK